MLVPILNMVLPVVLATPALRGFLAPSNTGGALTAAASPYSYKITALIAGVETDVSAAISTSIASGTAGSIKLAWLSIDGATHYKIYRNVSGTYRLVTTVAAPLTTYVDVTADVSVGAAAPAGSAFAEVTATPGLYVAPADTVVTIRNIIVTNPTNYTGRVYLSKVPVGGTGGASNRIVGGALCRPDVISPADVALSRLINMNAGDFLTGYATVPGLVITVDGLISAASA